MRWKTAFDAIPKEMRRLVHVRGCATVGQMLFVIAASGTAMLLMRSDNAREFLGEAAVVGTMGVIVDLLPSGFIASLVMELESDETPRVRTVRKIVESLEGYWEGDDALKSAMWSMVGEMYDNPLQLPTPTSERLIPVPRYTIPWWQQIPGVGQYL